MKTSWLKTFAIICILIFSFGKTEAAHALASGIAWSQVGKDSFLITYTFYIDCNGITGSFQVINFKCKTTGASFTSISINKPSPIDVTPVCESSCNRCQSASCSFPYGIEKYIFSQIVSFAGAGSCCDILITAVSGSRTTNITTGAASSSFYTEARMNRCFTSNNSSPVSSSIPAIILCVDQDFNYSMGAYDIDVDVNGQRLDSLSFEWDQPKDLTGSPILYSGSYSYEKPIYFWGFPNSKLSYPRGLRLDPATGDISFRPYKIESTIATIRIKEWRKVNGTMTNIGSVRREMWFCVVSCSNEPPVLGGLNYKGICAGEEVSFSISTNDYDTKDTLHISWDKNIPDAKWTDNNDSVKHPTGQLTWKTKASDISSVPYLFTATVKDNACPINGITTRTYQVMVKPVPTAKFTITDLGCGNYSFSAFDINPKSVTCKWIGNFSPGFSITGTAFSFKFNKTGKFPIKLEVGSSGCLTTYDTTLTVNLISNQKLITFDTIPVLCLNSSPLNLSTFADPDSGLWTSYPKSMVSGNIFFPSKGKVGKNRLYYQVFDSLNCVDLDSTEIELLDLPIVNAGNDDVVCPNASDVSLSGTPVGGSWSGKGVIGSTFAPKDAKPGSHTLVYSFNNGICINSDSIEILVTSFPDTNLTRTGDSIFAVSGMKSYSWYCNDTLIANQTTEKIRMHKAGSYYAMIEDSNQCSFKTQIITGTLGIKALDRSQLTIIPNPADDFILIDYTETNLQFDLIKISNSTGEIVFSMNYPVLPFRINISNLSKGIYFIKAIEKDGTIDKKIIIR